MKKKSKALVVILVILLLAVLGTTAYYFLFVRNSETTSIMYLANDKPLITLTDENQEEATFPRGTEVLLSDKKKEIDSVEYSKVYIGENTYYLLDDKLVERREDCVKENELWVYRTCSVYVDDSSSKIIGLIEKGRRIEITGHSKVKDDGTVDRYAFADGYVLNKYLTDDEIVATNPDPSDYASSLREKTENSYGAGSPSSLDYYPNEKPDFEDNKMPEICKALYINKEALYDIEEYIDFAKQTNINTFVVDIRDAHIISCAADTMKEYSPSTYNNAAFSKEEFTSKIKEIKDAGFYLVARITVFKDKYFMDDHPEYAILDKNDNNNPFWYGNSLWPSAYCREVWQYNVELSKEVVTDMGFNEVQFDYVRFPEQIDYYADVLDALDLQNKYEETRAEAIQRFLMYACDEIHAVGAYVSADVFGETANNYVCAYGQYLPAISNVVDVVSPMPYPDHFNPHDFGIEEVVWEVPYRLLCAWGPMVKKQQSLIPTPAKIRTYIQGYDAIYEPHVFYDNAKIEEQIQALIDTDIYDGYIVWNSGSFIDKYWTFYDALSKY